MRRLAMELRARPEHAGERLDAFLAAPLGSRSRAQRLIDAGAVTVDGRRVAKSHVLEAGDLVLVDERETAPAAQADAEPASFTFACTVFRTAKPRRRFLGKVPMRLG